MIGIISADSARNRTLLLLVLGAVMVFLVPALSGEQESKVKMVPMTSEEYDETSGAKIFHSHCATCHGQEGKGDGPAARALKTAPANLTQLARNNAGKFPASRVMTILGNASAYPSHGSKEMPIWGPVFSQMGIDKSRGQLRVSNLVEYLKSIQVK